MHFFFGCAFLLDFIHHVDLPFLFLTLCCMSNLWMRMDTFHYFNLIQQLILNNNETQITLILCGTLLIFLCPRIIE